jgi:hypothetical protein
MAAAVIANTSVAAAAVRVATVEVRIITDAIHREASLVNPQARLKAKSRARRAKPSSITRKTCSRKTSPRK